MVHNALAGQPACAYFPLFAGLVVFLQTVFFAIMPDDASSLTHLNPEGGVRMVDVGSKPGSARTATAAGRVRLGKEAFHAVVSGTADKGNVLCTAQVAGIQAAKRTAGLIPLCHIVALAGIEVTFDLCEEDFSIEVQASAKAVGQTGVEMEALTAVSVACLTVYDMCKAISKDILITDIRLLTKAGGESGAYKRSPKANPA